MKSMRIGMVLSSVVVLGVIGVACDKSDPQLTDTATDVVEVVKVEAEVAQAPAPVVETKAEVGIPAWLNEFFGDKLLVADGSEVSLDELAGKTIGIYFSAHWCPPCRGFTPVLVKTYDEIVAAGKPFELVFVSSDQSEEKMFGYMKEAKMAWKALPFGSDKKSSLSTKYGVRGIPTLVIVDKDGNTISKNARGDISSKGAAAFDQW